MLAQQRQPRPPAGGEDAPRAGAMRRARPLLRAALAGVLGVLAAVLISCGGSGKGLIPVADAGPLQSDFEAVAGAAENGDGSCTSTESALLKTEQDFAALPPSVDGGLRNTIHQGIANLRTHALALCTQPLPQSTVTTPKTTTSTTSTDTTPTETQTTPSEAQTTPPPSPSGPGGGTPAPREEGEEEGPGLGKGEGGGKDHKERGGVGGTEPGVGEEAGK